MAWRRRGQNRLNRTNSIGTSLGSFKGDRIPSASGAGGNYKRSRINPPIEGASGGDDPLLYQFLPRPSFFANGQTLAHVAGLIGFAGFAVIFSAGPNLPSASSQPQPQQAQYEFASRDPGGRAAVWGTNPALFPSGAQPASRVSAAPQADFSQIQPVIWKQTPGQREIPRIGQFSSVLQTDPSQTPPQFFKQAPEPAAVVQVGPFEYVFSLPQADLTQPAPYYAYQNPALREKPVIRQFSSGPQSDPSQIQPRISPYFFSPAVAATVPFRQLFAAQQADPSQIPPKVWGPQLDFFALPGTALEAIPPQVEPDRQPAFFRLAEFPAAGPTVPVPQQSQYEFAQRDTGGAAFIWSTNPQLVPPLQAPPFRVISAAPQADPSQIQPWIQKQFFAPVISAPPFAQISASPQSDPTQIQPVIWEQTPGQRERPIIRQVSASPQVEPDRTPLVSQTLAAAYIPPPNRPGIFASPQADPTQTQPWVQPPFFDQLRQQTPFTQFFSSPQADPTQIAPWVGTPTAALLPSVIPPVVRTEIDGGVPRKKTKSPRQELRELLEEPQEVLVEVQPAPELPPTLQPIAKVIAVPQYHPPIEAIPITIPPTESGEDKNFHEVALLVALGLI